MKQEFHEIYEKYSSDLYTFILRLCGDEQLAKDILQDTMLKAMTSAESFREAAPWGHGCVLSRKISGTTT